MYLGSLRESASDMSRQRIFEDWKHTSEMLGDGTDFFQTAMVKCCKDDMPMTTYYIKNQGDLEWDAIADELNLLADLRWGQGGEDLSQNWLAYSEKVRCSTLLQST